MDRSSIAILVNETYTTDALLQQISIETTSQVFCNIDSVTRSEWNVANQNGLNPEYRLTMFSYDYNGEKIVALPVNNSIERFSVYRTYQKPNDLIELYLERKSGTK